MKDYPKRDPRFVNFGKRVRDARGKMSQEDFAEKTELSVASIRRAEAGCTISRSTIEKLENALCIDFDPQNCTDIYTCPRASKCLKEIAAYLTQFPNSKNPE